MCKMETLAYSLLFSLIAREAFALPLVPSDPKPFIYRGEDAPAGFAPHMAALLVGGCLKMQVCGGSIISLTSVLTTAHCVVSVLMADGSLMNTFEIRVGSNQWNSGGTILRIKGYQDHPSFDFKNHKYDVAVFNVEGVVGSAKVAPIGISFDIVGENEECLITGWGKTEPKWEGDVLHLQPTPDDLQVLYTTTMSHEQCKKLMADVTGGRSPPIRDDIEICTFHSVGHGMCLGDAGNPVVRLSTGEMIGIISWGFDCAAGAPDVAVKLSGTSIKEFLEPFLHL